MQTLRQANHPVANHATAWQDNPRQDNPRQDKHIAERHDNPPTDSPKFSVIQDSESVSKEQLTQLYNDHYKSLVRMASFLLDDLESCEEVVQDAFVKLCTVARPQAGKEAAYLRMIVMNSTRSRMRRRMVRRRFVHDVPEPVASAESSALSNHDRQTMLQALRSLPRRQAEVLTLRFYENLSEAEIADSLGISVGSVKTHASRGLAGLRNQLQGSSFGGTFEGDFRGES